jgi:chromate transporter
MGPGDTEPSAPLPPPAQPPTPRPQAPLSTVAAQWTRLGCIGFGGPPTHISLLRRLCVHRYRWLTGEEFEHGIAAANLLPGPASTQLAIYCAWRVRGALGALVGGLCFILPGLMAILALSALLFDGHPPLAVRGAAAGAGAAVAAVALRAASDLAVPGWSRVRAHPHRSFRWICWLCAGGVAAALIGPLLVLVLIGCGLIEATIRGRGAAVRRVLRLRGVVPHLLAAPALAISAAAGAGGTGALVWVAFKVGALSYGGGFVIIPLMQGDAVHRYHWMTSGQFLDGVALGQITPGPVVLTVATVGYAAAGLAGGLLAVAIAFTPSFVFVLGGARHFDKLRGNTTVQAFLAGAGPAAIGAIAGSAIPLTLALQHLWQIGVLAAVAAWLLVARHEGDRRGVVSALAGAAALGVIAALAGAPVS